MEIIIRTEQQRATSTSTEIRPYNYNLTATGSEIEIKWLEKMIDKALNGTRNKT